MTRRYWTTAAAGRAYGKRIIGRCLSFIIMLGCVLTVAWAISPNQPNIP